MLTLIILRMICVVYYRRVATTVMVFTDSIVCVLVSFLKYQLPLVFEIVQLNCSSLSIIVTL